MENPDLVPQETGSSPTHSRINYFPSGDTLRRDAISSFCGDCKRPVDFKGFYKVLDLWMVKNLELQIVDD